MAQPLASIFTKAVDEAIAYVLDGPRTGRFYLMDPSVDSDERRTVGTKLQYHVIEGLGLVKAPPLDTHIANVAVELKGTIGDNWMIPREGQCQVSLVFQIDAARDLHRALLIRAHRRWLVGSNGDGKRNFSAPAFRQFAIPILPWAPIPPNPLRLLTPAQLAHVFNVHLGQTVRLAALFGYLPQTLIPRHVILTVGAGRKDSMRRAREARALVLGQYGLRLLCGRWTPERQEAARLGFQLGDEDWVAVP